MTYEDRGRGDNRRSRDSRGSGDRGRSRDSRGGSRGGSYGGSRGGRSGGRSGGSYGGSRGGSYGGRSGGGRRDFNRRPREMHKAVCTECGEECEVPFKPTEGKPVYCNDCFRKKRDNYN